MGEGGEKNYTLNADQLKKEIEFLCLEMLSLSQLPVSVGWGSGFFHLFPQNELFAGVHAEKMLI